MAAQDHARCAFLERCAAQRGRLYPDLAACEGSTNSRDRYYRYIWNLGIYDYADGAYFILDQERAQRCIDHYAALSCDVFDEDFPECQAVGLPTVQSSNGQVCTEELVAPAHLCDPEAMYCGRKDGTNTCNLCAPKKGNGENCKADVECESNFCWDWVGSCAAPMSAAALRRENESCDSTDQCLGNLVCVGPASGKTCRQRGGEGATCDPPGTDAHVYPPCQEEMDCVLANPGSAVGACMQRLDDGASCWRNKHMTQRGQILTHPSCKRLCVFPAVDSDQGVCTSAAEAPGPDEPCAAVRGMLAVGCRRDGNVWADFTAELDLGANYIAAMLVSCTCRNMTGEGQACWTSLQCSADFRCSATESSLSPGTCVAKRANAEPCIQDQDCLSDFCDPAPATNVCAVKPACP